MRAHTLNTCGASQPISNLKFTKCSAPRSKSCRVQIGLLSFRVRLHELFELLGYTRPFLYGSHTTSPKHTHDLDLKGCTRHSPSNKVGRGLMLTIARHVSTLNVHMQHQFADDINFHKTPICSQHLTSHGNMSYLTLRHI